MAYDTRMVLGSTTDCGTSPESEEQLFRGCMYRLRNRFGLGRFRLAGSHYLLDHVDGMLVAHDVRWQDPAAALEFRMVLGSVPDFPYRLRDEMPLIQI